MCAAACPGLEPYSSELVLWRLTQQCCPQAACLFYNRGDFHALKARAPQNPHRGAGPGQQVGLVFKNHWKVQSTATHPPRGLACCSVKKSQPFGSLNIASPKPLSSAHGGCMLLAQTQSLLGTKPKSQQWGRAVARIFCTIP